MTQFDKDHEKLKATIHIPEPFTGALWETYARVGRENGEVTVANAHYLKALAVLERAEVVIGDKTLDLDDLKKLGLDAPLAVIGWVGATVSGYVNDQFDVSKNSSEPPSNQPATAAGKTEKAA